MHRTRFLKQAGTIQKTTLALLAGSLLILPVLGMHAQAEDEAASFGVRGISARINVSDNVYRISTGDTLSLNLYNQSDLSNTSILVRSDGYASFNGIGEVAVAGKTVREVTLQLEEAYRDLVRQPIVSLSVTEAHPPTVYLAGAVMKPGMLQVSNSSSGGGGGSSTDPSQASSSQSSNTLHKMDYRLSSILSAAGGVRMDADLANVQISRNAKAYRSVNLWDMLKTGDASQDIMLQNGDSVFIPTLPQMAMDDATYETLLRSSLGPRNFPVRVVGNVKNPGVFELTGPSPYLNSAIAKGGGFGPGANRKKVAIRRFTSENKFSTVFVDSNHAEFMLRPNDVVYVPEQKIATSGNFMEHVTKVLSPFTSLSSTFFSYALLKRSY